MTYRTMDKSYLIECFGLAIMFAPFFISNRMIVLFGLGWLYHVGRIVGIVFLCDRYRKRKYYPSKLVYVLIVGEIYLTIVTLCQACELIFSALNISINILVFVMVIESYIQENCSVLFDMLLFLFELCIYSDVISILLKPEGYVLIEGTHWRSYLLDGHTTHIKWILPCIVVSSILWRYQKRIRALVLLIVTIVLSIFLQHKTAIIAFLFMCIFMSVPFLRRRINIWVSYLGGCVFCVAIIVLKLQSMFSFLIIAILHRDLSFTGRTGIWGHFLEVAKKNWLCGIGKVYDYKVEEVVFSHAHNMFLDELIKGGVIYVIMCLIFWLILDRSLRHKRDDISLIVYIGIMGVFIVGMTDVTSDYALIYLIYVLGYHHSEIHSQLKQQLQI